MNPETLLAALTGAAAVGLYAVPALRRAREDARSREDALVETQGVLANLRRDLATSDAVASTMRAGKQRVEDRLEEATRYAGWKGVYTKPDGTEVNVVGVGPCTLKPGRVVVENADKPGSTVFDVDRERVRWEG